MLATLRQRNFALLWCAGLISLIGSRAMMTALPFYVYQQTGATLATAALFAAAYLPMVLLGSVAGVFVDRWDRKRIMVLTNLIQTVVMLLLLLVRSSTWLWLVLLVAFVETSVAMFFGPAERALLPRLVREDQLIPANALAGLLSVAGGITLRAGVIALVMLPTGKAHSELAAASRLNGDSPSRPRRA